MNTDGFPAHMPRLSQMPYLKWAPGRTHCLDTQEKVDDFLRIKRMYGTTLIGDGVIKVGCFVTYNKDIIDVVMDCQRADLYRVHVSHKDPRLSA